MTTNQIIPVFIIGAARNGTTSLTNMISSFPEFAEIEHELHRGNHEAKLYNSYKYYGDISKPDKYIDFLFHYSSGDYFQLAKGDIEYHLKNPKLNFFEFYFDMMNHYCISHEKKYWLAKLDTSFFTDKNTFDVFISTVQQFYKEVKYVRIQRNFDQALLSALYMPGKKYSNTKTGIKRHYRILGYTQQWFKTYLLEQKKINKQDLIHIDFEDLISDKQNVMFKIRKFLNLSSDFILSKPKQYSVNTSFSKTKKPKLSGFDLFISNNYLKFLKTFPSLPSHIQSIYTSFLKSRSSAPISRRLLKYKYFKKTLRNELQKYGSFGLVEKLNKEIKEDK